MKLLDHKPHIHFLGVHIETWTLREMLWVSGYIGMLILAIVAGVVSLFTKY